MKYSDYLKSPTWYNLRKQALKKADYRCQTCNDTENINVHHRVYPKVLGTEPVSDLVVLCRSCHKIFHVKKVMPQFRIIAIGKIKTGKKRIHYWVKSLNPGEVRALCNPSFIYHRNELFEPEEETRYCKVCLEHKKRLGLEFP